MTSILFRLFLHLLPVLLCLGVPVVPAAAQTPEPARFLLESIVVEGVQRDAPREIVVGESLLKPGGEYTEQELREAVYRVKRLPFVLDAELSLRKGSERGAYELVITVEETRTFFYSADLNSSRSDYTEGSYSTTSLSGTAGARWFVGSRGLVYGSVQGQDEDGPWAAQVGYTHYNLFGRGGFASVGLLKDLDDGFGDIYLWSLSLGFPIVGNHSLRADLSASRSSYEFAGSTDKLESQFAELSWIYDTTDDPLFPTTGTKLVGSAGYGTSENDFGDLFNEFDSRSDARLFSLQGKRIWTLTPRQSVAAELGAMWRRYSGDVGFTIGGARYQSYSTGLSHTLNLWGFEKTERIGDFRWENGISIQYDEGSDNSYDSRLLQASLRTGLAFRNAFGVVRVSLSYSAEPFDEYLKSNLEPQP